MLRAPVDSNVLVSGIISRFSNSSCFQVYEAIFQGHFRLLSSDATLRELERVIGSERFLPQIKAKGHSVSELMTLLKDISEIVEDVDIELPIVVRDVTDRVFLKIALIEDADYFVTNDHRHLGSLKKIGRTKIVTPHKFMQTLNATR